MNGQRLATEAPSATPTQRVADPTTSDGSDAPIAESHGATQPASRVGRPAALLAIAVGVGQLFGIARELFIAAQVGADVRLDAALIAIVAPTVVGLLFVGGTATAMVPAIVRTIDEHGEEAGQRLTSSIVTWTLIVGVLGGILIVAFASTCVAIAGPGLSAEGRALAESFMPMLGPLVLFQSLTGLLVALFQMRTRFRPIALAWVMGPIVAMVTTVIAFGPIGIAAVPLGAMLGAGATFGILLVRGWRDQLLPPLDLRRTTHGGRGFLRHAGPLWLSSGILNLNLVGDRAIGSLLAEGAVSVLRYGDGIVRLPISAIGPAWTTAIYPSFVRAALPRSSSSVGAELGQSLRYLLAIFVPLSAATIALAPLLVDVAYRRGAFTAEDATATSLVVAALAPLVVLTMLNALAASAHNARQNGRLLLLVGILMVGLNIALDLVLGRAIGVAGIALASSIALGVVTLILIGALHRVEPSLRIREITGVGVRSLAASVVAAVPIGIIVWTADWAGSLPLEVAALVGLSLAGGLVYLVASRVLGLAEPLVVLRSLWGLRPGRAGA